MEKFVWRKKKGKKHPFSLDFAWAIYVLMHGSAADPLSAEVLWLSRAAGLGLCQGHGGAAEGPGTRPLLRVKYTVSIPAALPNRISG